MAKFHTERYLHNTQIQSSMISGVINAPTITHKFAAATVVAIGDFLLIAKLPERAVISHIEVVCSAIGGTMSADVGVMNDGETAITAKFLTATSLVAAKWFKVSDNIIDGRLAPVRDLPATIAIEFKAAGTIPKDAVISITPHYRHAGNDE